MDGMVIGSTPLVPINDTLATPMAHLVNTALDGAPGVPALPAAGHQPTFSFAATGRSVFSYTFTTPSPGDYVIMALLFSSGDRVPISPPAVSLTPDMSTHELPTWMLNTTASAGSSMLQPESSWLMSKQGIQACCT